MQKIHIVKFVRVLTGLSFAEAKELVNRFVPNFPDCSGKDMALLMEAMYKEVLQRKFDIQ